MSTDKLSEEEKQTLLSIARESMQHAVKKENLSPLELNSMSSMLRANGASFVTLTIHGNLRGCIGALEPYQPLALDVREHAIASALDDPRFPPVTPSELDQIEIEISRLTVPERLEYTDAEDLLAKLRPHVDGVILRDGFRRATFLPQVWDKIPDKADFLDNLCYKMGAPQNLWGHKHLEVLVYQVEEFHE